MFTFPSQVLCVQDGAPSAPENCSPDLMPASEEDCNMDPCEEASGEEPEESADAGDIRLDKNKS